MQRQTHNFPQETHANRFLDAQVPPQQQRYTGIYIAGRRQLPIDVQMSELGVVIAFIQVDYTLAK